MDETRILALAYFGIDLGPSAPPRSDDRQGRGAGFRFRQRPMAANGTADIARILIARGLRAFGDGCIALLLPVYLVALGFTPLEIGAIVTSTLIGTALLTL